MAHHVHVPRVAVFEQREQRREQRNVPQEQTPAVRRDQRREQRDERVRVGHGRVRVRVDGVQLEFREARRRERLAHGRAGRLDQAPRRRGDERGERRGVAADAHRRQGGSRARAVSCERGERAERRLHHLFRDARALIAERAEQLRDELGLVRGEERRHRGFGGLVRTPARVALGGGAVNLQEHDERHQPEQRRATRLRGVRGCFQPRQTHAREQRETQARGNAVRFRQPRGERAVALAGRRELGAVGDHRASPRGPQVTQQLVFPARAVKREVYLPEVGNRGRLEARPAEGTRGAAPRFPRWLPAPPRRAPRRRLRLRGRRPGRHAEDADRHFLRHVLCVRFIRRPDLARGVRGAVRQVAAQREQPRPQRRRRAEAVPAAARRASRGHRQQAQRVQRHARVVAAQQRAEVLAGAVHVLVRAVLQKHARRADDPARRLRRERRAERRDAREGLLSARRDVRLEERVEVVQNGHPVHQVALRVTRGQRRRGAEGRVSRGRRGGECSSARVSTRAPRGKRLFRKIFERVVETRERRARPTRADGALRARKARKAPRGGVRLGRGRRRGGRGGRAAGTYLPEGPCEGREHVCEL